MSVSTTPLPGAGLKLTFAQKVSRPSWYQRSACLNGALLVRGALAHLQACLYTIHTQVQDVMP